MGQKRHRFHANIGRTADTKHTHDRGPLFQRARRIAGWALALAFVAPWFNIPLDNADSAGMLAHLHAFFVDGDLLYDDEYEALRMSPLFAFVTSEGVVSNHWPTGGTWLQAPGFALAVASGKILRALELPGGQAPWTVWLLGLQVWAMVLLIWLGRGLARMIGGRTGLLYASSLIIGTPLLFYAAQAPARPHLYGACVVFLVVRLWMSQRGDGSLTRSALLGLLIGLAASVRPQLAPLGLLAIHDAWGRQDRWRHVGVAAACCFAWPLTNLGLQWWMYGADLSGYFDGEVSHHLRHFLLSPYHGVMTWSPLVVVAIIGLGIGVRARERGAWLLLFLLAWQLWVDSGYRPIQPGSVLGTRTWAGGTAFGPRKLVDVVPLLVPGLCWLRDWAAERGLERAAVAIVMGCAGYGAWLYAAVWLDPTAAERVLDGEAFAQVLGTPLRAGAWAGGWEQRTLPLATTCVLLLLVGVPLGAGLAWVGGKLAAGPLRIGVGLCLGACLLAHAWLAVLKSSSDAELERAPARMVEVARRLSPPHFATVARAAEHRDRLRAKLGADAAPEPE